MYDGMLNDQSLSQLGPAPSSAVSFSRLQAPRIHFAVSLDLILDTVLLTLILKWLIANYKPQKAFQI